MYTAQSHALLYLFDVNNRESFEQVKEMLLRTENNDGVCRILVGNKVD